MINTANLIDYCEQLCKQGTSGFSTEDEKNKIIYSVQYEILAILCDNYENNQKVSDALINHVVTINLNTNAYGEIEISEDGSTASNTSGDGEVGDYYRTLAVLYNGIYPATKIGVNEKAMYLTSPIRKPDVNKNRTMYYLANGNINMLPEQELDIQLIYCKKPDEARIVYESISGEDDDYLVVDEADTINIGFPEGLFNLFAYSILEKLGIEMKDNLILEYSNLGIQREYKSNIV